MDTTMRARSGKGQPSKQSNEVANIGLSIEGCMLWVHPAQPASMHSNSPLRKLECDEANWLQLDFGKSNNPCNDI